MARQLGFTLIELIITATIIAILAAIAIPSYKNYLIHSRRQSAITDLLQIQLLEERYRVTHSTYGDNSQITLPVNLYYNYKISSASANSYVLEAIAQDSQSNDTGCTHLTIDQNNTKLPGSCWQR